ncbi:MAG: hypothetical protein OXG33_01450 [Chloroflexi bacterium]|nr:hypothetical protein [Chloroflexota bacterium]
MDEVPSVCILAASTSPGIDALRSRVEFHRRSRFDATIILHDGHSFGAVRQGLALRRRLTHPTDLRTLYATRLTQVRQSYGDASGKCRRYQTQAAVF